MSGEFNDEFFAGGDVRLGDIILLVDSDTRVPEDCLSKTSGEWALLMGAKGDVEVNRVL